MQGNLWFRQLFALVGKEFQQIVRDPSSYLVAGVLPFIFLLLFGYGITLDAGVLRLAVLDQSGGRSALSLAADFAHSPWFSTRSVGTMPLQTRRATPKTSTTRKMRGLNSKSTSAASSWTGRYVAWAIPQ